jgi:hypothetical protein
MANINLSALTAPNGAAEYNEIIYKELMGSTTLNTLFNVVEGQLNGKKVALLGGFGLLGKKSEGCNPTYENSLIDTNEKTWDIEEWQIAENICYADLKGTLVQYAMRSGIDAANLVDTDYFKSILKPALEAAIKRLIIRLAYFGDTAITSASLKGVDVKYFNVIDGVWKQIFDGVAAGTITRTTIAANAKTSVDAQYSAMDTAGEATKLLRKIVREAPAELRAADNKVMYISQALYDAYASDAVANNVGSEAQWTAMSDGLMTGRINGIETIVVSDWDLTIQNHLKNTTNADAYDNPFRAIFTTKDNIVLGTESDGNFNALNYGFNEETQVNWILAKNTIGAMVRFDKLTHVAF